MLSLLDLVSEVWKKGRVWKKGHAGLEVGQV